MKYYVKEIPACTHCPHFCDEGEFCHHPKNKGEGSHGWIKDHEFPQPKWCPLSEDPFDTVRQWAKCKSEHDKACEICNGPECSDADIERADRTWNEYKQAEQRLLELAE